MALGFAACWPHLLLASTGSYAKFTTRVLAGQVQRMQGTGRPRCRRQLPDAQLALLLLLLLPVLLQALSHGGQRCRSSGGRGCGGLLLLSTKDLDC